MQVWWRREYKSHGESLMLKKIYKSYDDDGMRCKSNNTEEEMQV